MTLCVTGKTLLARTLAKVLDVPFSISDATSFTQVRFRETRRVHPMPKFCTTGGM